MTDRGNDIIYKLNLFSILMNILEVFIVFLVAAFLGLAGFIVWGIYTEKASYEEFVAPAQPAAAQTAQVLDGGQFYPNMRFPDRNISYGLGSYCTMNKFENVKKAFDILGQKTNLEFYNRKDNPDIEISCLELAPEEKTLGKKYFIAGEGGPSEVINATIYSVILKGKIGIYREEKCDEPNVAIHEILHALGFDHVNNTGSIMNPISSCSQQIDDYIVATLNKLYAVDSLPDLVIERAAAVKRGGYIDFNITVANYGLRVSRGVKLEVYADGSKADDFDLESIDIGTKKTLNVDNLDVSGGAEKISFFVSSSIDKKEINSENNGVEISVVR